MTAGVVLWVCAMVIGAHAQQTYQQRSQRGQNVVPVYEGWERNPDGTFTMFFGYLNRNYEEELYIPIGAENHVEPGSDRGQPTHFVPRTMASAFKVTVPKDWGDQEVVWTLTAYGRTERAYGSLSRIWEISTASDALPTFSRKPNKPPEITIERAAHAATVGKPLSLSINVRDDGIPEPRPAAGRVPARGLEVVWTPYRGPATVAFTPMRSQVTNHLARTQVTFGAAGSYVLRVFATDGQLTSERDITVTVSP
jgi:hypothetical protein